MKSLAIGMALAAASTLLMAEGKIYQWQNSNGVTVFSDQPHPGAREVEVQPPAGAALSPPAVAPRPTPAQPEAVNYRLTIVVPEDQATLRDNAGRVTVIATTEPTPGRSHRYRLLLDGHPTAKTGPAAHFQLEDLDRGEHQVQIVLTDNDGKNIAYSQTVTFFLHRASALNRPNTGGL